MKIVSCTGKKAFKSWTEAERVRKIMCQNHDGIIFRQYMCKYCERWHIGESTST